MSPLVWSELTGTWPSSASRGWRVRCSSRTRCVLVRFQNPRQTMASQTTVVLCPRTEMGWTVPRRTLPPESPRRLRRDGPMATRPRRTQPPVRGDRSPAAPPQCRPAARQRRSLSTQVSRYQTSVFLHDASCSLTTSSFRWNWYYTEVSPPCTKTQQLLYCSVGTKRWRWKYVSRDTVFDLQGMSGGVWDPAWRWSECGSICRYSAPLRQSGMFKLAPTLCSMIEIRNYWMKSD